MIYQQKDIAAYYTAALDNIPELTRRNRYRAECPFHSDPRKSFTFQVADGYYACVCGSGRIEEFEMRRSQFGDEGDPWGEAKARIDKIILRESVNRNG